MVNEETPCIISSYMDLEFAPYIYNEKLKTGNYEISVYSIKTEKEKSTINKCDSLNIRVIDTTPDVEVEQIAQTYSEKPKKGWENAITDYFTFKYDGEDISKYITKVACVEASSGSVFVKSVEFQLENQYYGVFTLTAEVERLITKQ